MMGFLSDPFGIQGQHDNQIFGNDPCGMQQAVLDGQLGAIQYGEQQGMLKQQMLQQRMMEMSREALERDPPTRPESEAVLFFLKNLRRIRRALYKVTTQIDDDGGWAYWTITEAHVPPWFAKELQKHPWQKRSDRLFCQSCGPLQTGDEIVRLGPTSIIIGSEWERIKFSYKRVRIPCLD
jgi:hypothetical protein